MSVEVEQDYKLFQGDCFDVLPSIPDGSIDFILTDPPYGVTNCQWDVKPDIKCFFRESWRALKQNGALVIFGTFKSLIEWVLEAKEFFRYDLIWEKCHPTGFLDANRKPLKIHETLLVFYRMLPEYHPQKTPGKPYKIPIHRSTSIYNNTYDPMKQIPSDGNRFPLSIVKYSNVTDKIVHPTQKPIALLEWLIKTYTSEGQTILDPFMGSGSVGVACMNLKRKFIGVELDEKFYGIAEKRIQTAVDNYQFKLFEE